MNRALTRSAWVCSGKRRPASSGAGSSGFRPAAIASDSPGLIRTTSVAVLASGGRPPGTPQGATRAGCGQARGHQPVLRLGRLDHQPRDPGRGGGLEQGAHALRLSGAGGPADEHVTVQRVERQHQRPGGTVAPVQDLADRDHLARRGVFLLGDVEVRPEHQPHAGNLVLRRPGQGRDQLGAGVEGTAEGRVPPGGGRARVLQEVAEAARAAVGRGHGVGQAVQVGRRAEEPGHA